MEGERPVATEQATADATVEATDERLTSPHPTVDLITDTCAVIVCTRPVVGLSSWLVDAVHRAPTMNRILTVVTPPTTRLTLPVHALAASGAVQWLIRLSDTDFYDGIRGTPVRFAGSDFTVDDADAQAAQFHELAEPDAWQVLLTMTVEHRAAVHTQLGAAVEKVASGLTHVKPAGWGVHEPVSERWDAAALTAHARENMPGPVRLTVVGAGRDTMIAGLTAERTDRGVEETVSCLVNAGNISRDLTEIKTAVRDTLRDTAAEVTVGFAVAHVMPGRADLTIPGTERAVPLPVSILVGPRAVRALGRDVLLRSPLPTPTPVGRPRVPGLRFDLGEGQTPPWTELAEFVTYLGPERLAHAAPELADLVR